MDKATALQLALELRNQLHQMLEMSQAFKKAGDKRSANHYGDQAVGLSNGITLIRKIAGINHNEYVEAMVNQDEIRSV